MKSSAMLRAAALLACVAANPVIGSAGSTCTPDTCLSGINSFKDGTDLNQYITFACTEYLQSTALVGRPATTTLITPLPTSTVYASTTTITALETIASATRWATTINSEVYSTTTAAATAVRRRDADDDAACQITATSVPDFNLPSEVLEICPQSSQFVSACQCAGFPTTLDTEACAATSTVPPTATVTAVSTATETRVTYVTRSIPTPLVDRIRCGELVQIDNDLPAYRIVCEAQGPANQTLKESVRGTDWDNCVERATWTDGAYSWEFDIAGQNCFIYSGGSDPQAGNKTRPRKDYVYAYI